MGVSQHIGKYGWMERSTIISSDGNEAVYEFMGNKCRDAKYISNISTW
jgi:hypothetical protein